MRKVLVFLVVVLLFAVVGILYAEEEVEEERVQFRLQLLAMDVLGGPEHVGDKYEYYDDGSKYGTNYQPILRNPKVNFAPRLEITYKDIVGSFWFFLPKGSVEGSVSSTSSYLRGVRFWGYNTDPIANIDEPSGISPVNYYATMEMKVITGDLAVAKEIADSGVKFLIGLKAGYLHTELSQGIYLHAWVPYDGSFYWDNHIYLDEISKSSFTGIGPIFGIQGDKHFGRFVILGSGKVGILPGFYDTSDKWTDIDDIELTQPGGMSVSYDKWEGTFIYNEEGFAAVPVAELDLEIGFKINDSWMIGLAVFSSTWFNAPTGPNFTISDYWSALYTTGINSNRRTLTFFGGGFSVTYAPK